MLSNHFAINSSLGMPRARGALANHLIGKGRERLESYTSMMIPSFLLVIKRFVVYVSSMANISTIFLNLSNTLMGIFGEFSMKLFPPKLKIQHFRCLAKPENRKRQKTRQRLPLMTMRPVQESVNRTITLFVNEMKTCMPFTSVAFELMSKCIYPSFNTSLNALFAGIGFQMRVRWSLLMRKR